MLRKLMVLGLLLVGTMSARALELESWLVAGPATLPHAQLDESEELKPLEEFLGEAPVEMTEFWPAAGDPLRLGPGEPMQMQLGELRFEAPEEGSEEFRYALAALYLDVPAWQEGSLTLRGAAPFTLWLDGEKVSGRSSVADSDSAEASGDVVLDQGHRRLLLLTAVRGADSLANWSLELRYEMKQESEQWLPQPVTTPRHPFDITDYYLQTSVSDLELTPDGDYLAADLARWDEDSDKMLDRLEIWDLSKERKLWDYDSPKGISNLAWRPDGKALLFVSSSSEGKQLFVWERPSGELTLLAKNLEKSSGFSWAPDGKGLYYRKSIPYEGGNDDYKVMWGNQDRWRGWRDRSQIRYFGIEGGVDLPVTDALYDPGSMVISPDGSTLVLARSVPDVERPFSVSQVWTVDTRSGQAQMVYEERFQSFVLGDISPDGERIVFAAPRAPVTGNDDPGPALNYYDRDLYVLDLASGEATRVTPDDFGPAVDIRYYGTGASNTGGFVWHEDGTVLFPALYMKKALLCSWSEGEEIETTQLGTPGFSDLAVAKRGRRVAYAGDVLDGQSDVYTFDRRRGRGARLIDMATRFDELTTPAPRVEDYDVTYFDHEKGDSVTVYGYLFYPEGYDADNTEASWPLVVDTYGGVIGFGDGWHWGSNVFANRGFFCYVPAPRGAAGYGSEYADSHPNDWGLRSSRDMNNGVRHIVRNVPGLDSTRVGFVSGSYGGFLAMYLLAMEKDNPDYFPYATTISDYGISNLVSYWGVGWWGYAYNDMAGAGSWPWNKPELYQRWSPIYRADNIDKPLLLLHGDADVNVPVMESDQMYTALKVLGRDDVAFVRFPGEDHGIASTRSKYLLSKRMHFEWFDKWLRDRPGAWDKRMKSELKK